MSYYAGKIKVICEDNMCFAAHPVTLEPLSCSTYDLYAWSDPDPDPIETLHFLEWQCRRNANRRIEEGLRFLNRHTTQR